MHFRMRFAGTSVKQTLAQRCECRRGPAPSPPCSLPVSPTENPWAGVCPGSVVRVGTAGVQPSHDAAFQRRLTADTLLPGPLRSRAEQLRSGAGQPLCRGSVPRTALLSVLCVGWGRAVLARMRPQSNANPLGIFSVIIFCCLLYACQGQGGTGPG